MTAYPPFDASEGLLTPEEVAELYGVEYHTVLRWARNYAAGNGGPSMPAIRTPAGPRGPWRFSAKFVRQDRG